MKDMFSVGYNSIVQKKIYQHYSVLKHLRSWEFFAWLVFLGLVIFVMGFFFCLFCSGFLLLQVCWFVLFFLFYSLRIRFVVRVAPVFSHSLFAYH